MRSSERLADPRKCAFRDALPAEVQVCDVKAANGDLRWLRVFSPAETVPAPRGFVLHQRLHQQSQDAIANSSLRAGTAAAFVFGGLRSEGQQPELKFRRAAFSRNSPVLENMDRKIEKRLVEVTLVRRYEVETDPCGRPSRWRGSFTVCSFLFVECLARAGQSEKAQLLLEKLLGYANHLGLYSEQLGANGHHLGNFPQAFTHLALISAATYLDRTLSEKGDGVRR